MAVTSCLAVRFHLDGHHRVWAQGKERGTMECLYFFAGVHRRRDSVFSYPLRIDHLVVYPENPTHIRSCLRDGVMNDMAGIGIASFRIELSKRDIVLVCFSKGVPVGSWNQL